jgi:hypothetical protein
MSVDNYSNTPSDINVIISIKPIIKTYFGNTHQKLKDGRKWINWEYGEYKPDKGKFDKKPCARFFDTYNPDKWISFDEWTTFFVRTRFSQFRKNRIFMTIILVSCRSERKRKIHCPTPQPP